MSKLSESLFQIPGLPGTGFMPNPHHVTGVGEGKEPRVCIDRCITGEGEAKKPSIATRTTTCLRINLNIHYKVHLLVD